MKLKEYRSEYYVFSAKAGDVARQLAFAGIAVIWVFKDDKLGQLPLPNMLYAPTAAFVLSLALDMLHYAYSSLVWGAYSHIQKRWKKHTDEDELGDAPYSFNWPALALFWGKLVSVIVGYWLLLQYVRPFLK